MYSISDLKGMLFIDIETSTMAKDLDGFAEMVGENGKDHWDKKSKWVRKNSPEHIELDNDRLYQLDAALYPEFGRVVCITIGQIVFEDGVTPSAKIKSFYDTKNGEDEKDILEIFMQTMVRIFHANPKISLVGHNVKGFDLPFLIKRAIINGVSIPDKLQLQKMKPWENCLVDTNDIWKFGGWNGASLSLICDLLQIPSPKENMYGGEVAEAFWNGRAEEIKDYCEDDVCATMNLMLKLSNMEMVSKERVLSKSNI